MLTVGSAELSSYVGSASIEPFYPLFHGLKLTEPQRWRR